MPFGLAASQGLGLAPASRPLGHGASPSLALLSCAIGAAHPRHRLGKRVRVLTCFPLLELEFGWLGPGG